MCTPDEELLSLMFITRATTIYILSFEHNNLSKFFAHRWVTVWPPQKDN
jgi:hypothetical protein